MAPRPASAAVLGYVRSINTRPFVGTATSMNDNEGLAYVPADDALWAADDSRGRLHRIDRLTGALEQTVTAAQLQAATRFAGTEIAGPDRGGDLESVAYDVVTDTLYAFSGTCCAPTAKPTAFRLRRSVAGAAFRVESWQPLPAPYLDLSGAEVRNGVLWVAQGNTIARYDYGANTVSSPMVISGVGAIYGMGFSPSGNSMWLAVSGNRVRKYDWATKTLVNGFDFAMASYGVGDARAVSVVGNELYVSDGDDVAAALPSAFGIRVLDVGATGGAAGAPVAIFTSTPTTGPAPLSVAFTDQSARSPSSWSWDFGDGTSSTVRNPTHVYAQPGGYVVRLTVSNAAGTSVSAPVAIVVGEAAGIPIASFYASPIAGRAPLTVTFADTSTNTPTSWSWVFGDGGVATVANPTHTFTAPGTYTVAMRATNGAGGDDADPVVIEVRPPAGPPGVTFAALDDSFVDKATPNTARGTIASLADIRTDTNRQRSYLKFTVTGLTGTVSSVRLRLWVIDGTDDGAAWYATGNGWSESTLTWNNAPLVTGGVLADPGVVTIGTWLELDVTAYVRGNGTFSFGAIPMSANAEKFSSAEGSTPPQLVVVAG